MHVFLPIVTSLVTNSGSRFNAVAAYWNERTSFSTATETMWLSAYLSP